MTLTAAASLGAADCWPVFSGQLIDASETSGSVWLWVMRLALLQILQDLMEGFLMVLPARRLALAALLVYGLPYLLTEFLSHLPEQACDRAQRASHEAA